MRRVASDEFTKTGFDDLAFENVISSIQSDLNAITVKKSLRLPWRKKKVFRASRFKNNKAESAGILFDRSLELADPG